MSDSETSSGSIPIPPTESAPDGGPRAVLQADGQVNPLAMTVAQAAKVLSAVGLGAITEELLRRHVATGAPAAADGRINLVHYAAWLNLRADGGQRMGLSACDAQGGKDPEGADEHGA